MHHPSELRERPCSRRTAIIARLGSRERDHARRTERTLLLERRSHPVNADTAPARCAPGQPRPPARPQDRGRYELEEVVRARRRAAIGIACLCPPATAGRLPDRTGLDDFSSVSQIRPCSVQEQDDHVKLDGRSKEDVMESTSLLDCAGRRRSPATTSSFHEGLSPAIRACGIRRTCRPLRRSWR